MTRLYLAGGLFNAGERFHNLILEKHLGELGYTVVLPQREALKFYHNGQFDLTAIVKDCARYCCDRDVLVVACIDGPDADSGTAVELGMTMVATQRAVVYRTDFRTSEENGSEAGVNAMLRVPGSSFIYAPCFATTIEEANAYYAGLAKRLHERIVSLPTLAANDTSATSGEFQPTVPATPSSTRGVPAVVGPREQAKANRERIEKVVIGFIVSLVLKATLDTAYGKADNTTGLFGLLGVLYTLNVVSFLTTMVRFVFGVFRIGEDMPPAKRLLISLVNFSSSLILFLGFYLAGLLIKDTAGFYHAIIAVHLVDAAWFMVARQAFFGKPFSDDEKALRKIFLQFFWIDIVTVVLVGILFPFPFVPPIRPVADFVAVISPEGAGLAVMGLVCLVDFKYHGRFFLMGLDAFRNRRSPAT